MPFAYYIISKYMPRNGFLPMQKTNKKHSFGERVSFLTSNKGSIIVEASLVIPIFLIVFVMLMHILILLNHQNNISNELYDNACKMGKNVLNYSTSENVDISYESVLKDGIVLKSSYKYKFPIGSLKIRQVLVFRKWSGESIASSKEKEDNVVYIAKNGKVYHTSKKCTHLLLSIKKIKYSKVNKKRYSKCKICISEDIEDDEEVYITDTGDRYHIFKDCSGLLRFITEIKIDEIGERKLCSRCAK